MFSKMFSKLKSAFVSSPKKYAVEYHKPCYRGHVFKAVVTARSEKEMKNILCLNGKGCGYRIIDGPFVK